MPFIDVEDLIGKTFNIPQDDNIKSKVTVVDAIKIMKRTLNKAQLILNLELNIVKINMISFYL